MDKRNKIYILVISIVLFVTAIIAFTFAYINRSNVNGNSNILATVKEDYSLVISGSNTLSLALTNENLNVTNANNNYSSYIDSNASNIAVTLTNPNYDVNTTCNYSFNYEATTAFTSSPQAVSSSLNELSIVINDGTNEYVVPVNDSTSKMLLNNAISATSSDQVITKNYSFKIRFYNLAVGQNSIVGQHPSGSITVSTDGCTKSTVQTSAEEDEIIASTNNIYSDNDSFANRILADNEGIALIEARNIPDFSSYATTYEGMYATDDDFSEITGRPSYYFRGAIDNNWVYFAEAYWRIIRINGDGSIRLMYSGVIAPEEETSIVMENDSIYIEGNNYNDELNMAEYVGWMYTIDEQHGHEVSSNIKSILDNWFENTFSNDANYLNYINNNQILCNDRTAYTASDGLVISNGFGSSDFQAFGAFVRYYNNQPSLMCPNNADAFTAYNALIGNNYLNYPVGLITQDEVIMAGLNDSTNTTNYLYVHPNVGYWTASPSLYDQNYAMVYIVPYNIDLELTRIFGIRPVISLKGDTIVTGDGTWDVPYVVQ